MAGKWLEINFIRTLMSEPQEACRKINSSIDAMHDDDFEEIDDWVF
jgi:hypothetical protein